MTDFIFKLTIALEIAFSWISTQAQNTGMMIRIGVSSYSMTLHSIIVGGWYNSSLYLPVAMRKYLYSTDPIVENNGKKYMIKSAKLGMESDILEPLLIYLNYNQPHTIGDLKLFHPEWYESCETITIEYQIPESKKLDTIEINMQAKKEVRRDRKLNFGEITFEEENSDDEW
jgi:hypothetical protein